MAKVSFFKKLKLYRDYRKILKTEKAFLESTYKVRIDYIDRMYTVINIPPADIEKYNTNTKDLEKLSQGYIKDFIINLGKYLDSKGLSELYKLYEVKRVDKYSTLVIIGFQPFNTVNFARILYYGILPVLFLLILAVSIKFL